MPSVLMKLRWPDDSTSKHMSPSTIIQTYFKPQEELPLDVFLLQAEKAFEHASERVKERYGFYCSQASDSFSAIKSLANNQSEGTVQVIDLEVMR